MKAPIPVSLWAFVSSVGLLTYVTTRGRDGHLFFALVGFAAFGVAYCVTKLKKGNETVATAASTTVVELLLFEFAAVSALIIDPQLDGMAGILNLAIPLIIFAIAATGFVLRTIRLYCGRSERVAFRVLPAHDSDGGNSPGAGAG